MKPLAIFGTGSDAGKTTIVMALCRIFADQDLKVAPFKAQNVSNNSAVTKENREIFRAQCLQAEAARVEPSYLFNPVLLKSHGNGSVQVIVNGLVYQNQSVAAYYDEIDNLKQQVQQSFSRLQQDYDLVIAEGAGSPVELNLLDKDLSNTFIAKTFSTKNILVADIERGGVFASIYGTLELMDPVIRSNLIGVVVNKFRGDRRFFDDGEKIIREKFGVPVLGVLPFQPLNIDMEDSQSLQNYQQRINAVKIRIAVIAYPGLSNYNDLDVLMADAELYVELIRSYQPLDNFDMVLLPGSKTVMG
ncbi:MAG: cobyric acid synthase, partial [Methylobacter sp.]